MRRHELAYLRLERSSLLAVTSQLEIEVQLTVDSLQLDQQLPGACYPVALQGLGGSEASGRAAAAAAAVAEDAPWLQLTLLRRRQEKRLRAVDLRLGEVRLHLEEALLAALHAFAQRAVPAPAAAPATTPAAAPSAATAAATDAPASPARGDGAAAPPLLMTTTLAEPPLPTAARKRPWYIDEVQLCALRLQVSYRGRPEGAAAEGEWRVPLTLPNLEGLPLGLASLTKRHFFISRRRLLEDFGKHYKGEVVRNLLSGKVLPRHANAPAAPATLHAHAPVAAAPEVPQAAAARLPLFPPALTAHRHEPPLPALTTHYLPPTADGPTHPSPTPYLPPTYPPPYCAPRCYYTPT